MKRLLLSLGALSLLTVMPVTPASADPGNSPDLGIVDFCKVDVPTNHPDLSLGNCIGSRTTANHSLEGWSEHVCFFYENELPDIFDMFYASYSECVRDKASQI